jgi:hypothetical protein
VTSQVATVITDHRMIFRVTPQATTLYDQIEYQGDPADFAWVLPIQGPVQVGLSSDVLFSALDAATQTTILAPPLPTCPSCACAYSTSGGGGYLYGGNGSSSGGGVTVISQMVVGPYETVQLKSTDPASLTSWLTSHGYEIPTDIASVIAAYIAEGFDFLAMRLVPGMGISAMRPVRVTSPGAGVTLPLRMVAAGTGATVGITLWVIGDGRYAPANFQSFTIDPSTITWDFSTQTSNYTSLRASEEATLQNTAWQIESSLDVGAYAIEAPVLGYGGASSGTASSGTTSSSGGTSSGGSNGDYLPIPASDGGAGETADQVRQDDLDVLFPGGYQGSVRVTRMRADLSHAALAKDLVLAATTDDSTLSNVYQVTKSVNATCPACGCDPYGANTPYSASASTSGGATGSSGSSGGGNSGCATAGDGTRSGLMDFGLAAVVGTAALGMRSRRRRKKGPPMSPMSTKPPKA